MRRLKTTKRDRAGTWRVEVVVHGKTIMRGFSEDGSSWYDERPWTQACLVSGMDGLSEFAAKRFVKRHPMIDGHPTRAISHEDHLAEVAAEAKRRRSESAKAAWRERRERDERKRKREFPSLKAVE